MKITKTRLRQIIKEEVTKVSEATRSKPWAWEPPKSSAPDSATELRGRMKALYQLVMMKRPDFELLDDPVQIFTRAYDYAGQTGMSNVHEIIAKMDDLNQAPDPRDVRPADWADTHDVMGDD